MLASNVIEIEKNLLRTSINASCIDARAYDVDRSIYMILVTWPAARSGLLRSAQGARAPFQFRLAIGEGAFPKR